MMFAAIARAQIGFEVASVKPSAPPGAGRGGPGAPDPDHFVCENFDLASLLMLAYEIPSYRLSAPSWMRNAKFDIVANVPQGTTKQQFLEQRFDLRTHWEMKEMRVYALVIAKGGSRLKESAAASPNVSIGSTSGITRMTFTGSPLEQFVRQM
jgi:uncharacterized protein (TIGR03435 family)